jgi:hypothetical protein
MAFRYSCFISYSNGPGDLTERFIADLKDGLDAYLNPYLRQEVFLDKSRISGGQIIDAALARAMCESVCMVLVFSPTYFDRFFPYCTREYRGMLDLEAMRLGMVSDDIRNDIRGYGCIIPVVFRGIDYLPIEIRQRRFYDLSQYTLATPDLRREGSYISVFDEIGKHVRLLYDAFMEVEHARWGECANFNLPAETVAVEWLNALPRRRLVFPGRSG